MTLLSPVKTDLELSLDHLAHKLRLEPEWSAVVKSALVLLRKRARTITRLRQEIAMAHTLVESIKYMTDKVASLSAANGTLAMDKTALTNENADLKKQLETAITNARTPEEAAAEAQLVALVDSLDPAPVAPPAV